MKRICPTCGAVYAGTVLYCRRCGQKTVPTGRAINTKGKARRITHLRKEQNNG